MKVIDLLNKIANGEEVPKIIIYGLNKWVYDKDCNDYFSDKSLKSFQMTYVSNPKWLNEEVEIIEDEFIDIEEIKIERDDILGYYNGASHRMTTNVKDREVYIKIINNLIKNQKKIISRLKDE